MNFRADNIRPYDALLIYFVTAMAARKGVRGMKSQKKQFFAIFLVVALLFAAKIMYGSGGVAKSAGEKNGNGPRLTSGQKWLAKQEEKKAAESRASASAAAEGQPVSVSEDGQYITKGEVALYLHTYGTLPSNFINKYEASQLGWKSPSGSLQEVAPGKSIGGSLYGNHEKALPDMDGRSWKECDINYEGGERGAERILYSNDGLIYYTGDEYKTFEQLY